MIGYINLLKTQIKDGFVQFLSSLNYINSIPIGMSDSVAGNDAIFVKGHAFKGSLLTDDYNHFILDSLINLTQADDFEITGWTDNTTVIQNRLGGDLRPYIGVSNQRIDANLTSSLRILLDYDTPVTADIISKWTLKKESDLWTISIETENGEFETKSTTDATAFNINFSRLFGRNFTSNNSTLGNDWDYKIVKNGALIHHWPIPFPIETPVSHIEYDVVGGNNGSLNNGTLNNNGEVDREDYYSQLGYYDDGTQLVPIKADLTQFADGTALGSGVVNDGTQYLNVGDKFKQPDIQDLKDADIDNVYFDIGGNQKDVTFSEMETAISSNPSVYGGDVVAGESIKNISLK